MNLLLVKFIKIIDANTKGLVMTVKIEELKSKYELLFQFTYDYVRSELAKNTEIRKEYQVSSLFQSNNLNCKFLYIIQKCLDSIESLLEKTDWLLNDSETVTDKEHTVAQVTPVLRQKESPRRTIWRHIVTNVCAPGSRINRKVLWNQVKCHERFKKIGTNEKRRNFREKDFYKWLNENYLVEGKKKKAFYVTIV